MGKRTVYEQIKKQNGEHFAQTISNYHNGIFDIPGIVDVVKYAGDDARPILKYLFSLKGIKIEPQSVHKDPFTLLAEAGYDAYYADTLEKQNAPEKYFAPGEELCTFRDPERFKKYHIIWCIKKDVDKIKREKFRGQEERQDEYGTSVICIQILKTGGMISIKNRYNHTVKNCDDTFNSNPDRIIWGLSDSLRHYLHTDFSARGEDIPGNFILVHNQLVRFSQEFDDIYFGDNFYLKDGEIHPMSSTELLMDNFIFDIKKKTVKNLLKNKDCFPKVLMDEVKDKKVRITKDKEGCYHLFADNVELVTVKNGQIRTLNLPTIEKIGDKFLFYNTRLTSFKAPRLKKVENWFLHWKEDLSILDVPSLQKVGDHFISAWNNLSTLYFPSLLEVGDYFLRNSEGLHALHAPLLKKTGQDFLGENRKLSILDTPSLKRIGWSLPRKFWDWFRDIDMGVLYSFGSYLSDYDACFLPLNMRYKTNAPALIKKLPPERILKKDFSLEERLTHSANSPVPMREVLKDQAHQAESSPKAKSKPITHHKKSAPKRFWGRVWQRLIHD